MLMASSTSETTSTATATQACEQQQGDHEAPEVRDLAIPERVLRVRNAPRAMHAEQEQKLVTRVCVRVGGLGEHTARPGKGGCPGLAERDAEVRGECVDDGA
jgi:hypothetical protein